VVYASVHRSVVRICESAGDAATLRLRLIRELRAAIGFDAYAWLLTDPETWVGSAPLADVPCLPELPQLIRLKYLTPVNRWTVLMPAAVALLRQTTGGRLSRSLLWNDLLSQYDVVDIASSVYVDRFGCWGFLDLWRSGASVPFDQPEADFLADLVEPITAALRRTPAVTFGARARHDESRHAPVVLLLSPDLDVLAQTAETQDYLRGFEKPVVISYDASGSCWITCVGCPPSTCRQFVCGRHFRKRRQ